MVDQGTIRELAAAVERQKALADEAKEDLNSAYAAAKAEGLDLAAFKSAMKLKRLEPTKLSAWLDTFDRCRDALGLDAQMDIEDFVPAELNAPHSGRKRAKRAARNPESATFSHVDPNGKPN